MQHLQGDRPVMLQVAGQVDRGHAPATELSLERIRMRQSLGERLLGKGHCDKSTPSDVAVRLWAAGARDSAHRKWRIILLLPCHQPLEARIAPERRGGRGDLEAAR